MKVPEEAPEKPPRAGPKGKQVPWDKARILETGVVRSVAIGVCGRGSVSARAANRSTSHSAGTSGIAKIRIVCERFVAGRRPGASGSTVGIPSIASVTRRPRQRGGSDDAKRPKRQAKTEILVLRTPQTVARGHAAKIFFGIFATVLGVTSRREPLPEHRLAIVAMIAARRCGVCGIVNASGSAAT